MSSLLLVGLFVLLIIYYIYKWFDKISHYFDEKGVVALKPTFLLGNTGKMILRKISVAEQLQILYYSFPNEPIIGFYDQIRPLFLVRDPELLKIIAVKEFDHFLDHKLLFDPEMEPLFGKSLFGLRGHAWKEMRSTLSPAFTGSKMRLMFELVCKCSDEMAEFCKKNNKNEIIELKDFFSRFSNDVIATCAFGIEVNSLENPNNPFYKMGSKMTKFGAKFALKMFIYTLLPTLCKKFKMELFDRNDTNFFRKIILETMNTREKENIIRPDMINLLLTAKKGQSLTINEQNVETKEFSVVEEHLKSSVKKEWSDNDVAAQCFLFFFAGFDTISTAMTLMAYELALNCDIQNRLIKEVDQINEELNGKSLTYDKLQEMKYMDMVVSETLRKWPPAHFADRLCTNDIIINYKNKNINFTVGDDIWIPIYAIHHDPQYYPNPDQFDPERFSDERKHEINPNTYIPFGIGPRNCIGSRFALMEAKAAFYSILKHFKFEVCDKTEKFEFGKGFRLIDKDITLRIKSR